MIYLKLFIEFIKVGLFAFGGGYGSIPLIRDVCITNNWLSEDGLAYMIALSESTPGPIMVNLATYVGSKNGGILGALVATIGVIIPAFIIVIVIVNVLETFIKNKYVKIAFDGLNPSIVGIILATGVYMAFNNAHKGHIELIISIVLLAIIIFIKSFKKKVSPISFILISGFVGILVSVIEG